MAEQLIDFVQNHTGVDHAVCSSYIEVLYNYVNPMFTCSFETFKRWYALQVAALSAADLSAEERMASALAPLKPREIDECFKSDLIKMGSDVLLELERISAERDAKTILLMWLVTLIQTMDRELHVELSQKAVSFFRRQPQTLHRAAGHGHLISWLLTITKSEFDSPVENA